MDRSADAGVVLITGYDGAIGSALAGRLRPRWRVIGLDRRCPDGDADCLVADITSFADLRRAIAAVRERAGERIASVVHLAAYFDMSGEPSPLYQRVNLDGTAHLLQALRELQVEQFVYAGTMLVHAPTEPGRPIEESWPLDPKWAYPESKLDAENVVRTRHGRVPIVVLRIAGMYTDAGDSATLAQQIARIDQRTLESRVFPGDTRRGQAFVHLDDLVDAIARTVERLHDLPHDLTLLIGEPGRPLSYADLQREFARLIHGEDDWPTREVPKALARTGAWLQDKAEDVVPDAIDQGREPFIKPFMIDLADDHFELDVSRARCWAGSRRARCATRCRK